MGSTPHYVRLTRRFNVATLLSQHFGCLSANRAQGALLYRTLVSRPSLLVLSRPFSNLSITSHRRLTRQLTSLRRSNVALMLILGHFSRVPRFIRFTNILTSYALTRANTGRRLLRRTLITRLTRDRRLRNIRLPRPSRPSTHRTLPTGRPHVILGGNIISCGSHPVLGGLD